jgi:hypothetical protein
MATVREGGGAPGITAEGGVGAMPTEAAGSVEADAVATSGLQIQASSEAIRLIRYTAR